MPELPEVETVAAQLRSRVVGRTILACRLWTPGMVRHPSPMPSPSAWPDAGSRR